MQRQYLTATEDFNSVEKSVCAPIFKRTFDYEGTSARLEIAVAGFYRLFLNGKEITKGFLAPYINNPDQVTYYDEYDVSSLMKEKGNELIVLLGNGFNNSQDSNIWDFEKASYRSAPKFYLGIFDGENRVLTTDEQFTVYDSPIVCDDYRCGMTYDARLEKQLFENGRKPLLAREPKGKYLKCNAQPIKVIEELKPQKITKCTEGYIYDFGQNNTGVCRLSINAKEGQEIRLTHGEIVNDGELSMANILFGSKTRHGYQQRNWYICKEGKQQFTPSFVYHGFRYVEVTGITEEQATKDLLTYLVIHSDVTLRGSFKCNNETLNKIQDCALRSDLSNFHYFPTDCPHREKNGWTGDITLSAEQMYYNFEATPSFKDWLTLMRETQTAEGAVPAIVPTDTWGYAWGAGMGWDTVMGELPYQAYRFSGDKSIVEDNIPMIEKYLEFMETEFSDEGLINYGLGEWVEIGLDNGCCSIPTEIVNSLNCMDFLAKVAELFKIVGQEDKAEKVKARREKLVADFRKKYVKDSWVNCKKQTPQVLALAYGVFTAEEETQAYENLLALIQEKGNRYQVGCFGMKFMPFVLSRFGNSAFAIELIAEPTYPSFGYWVEKRKATTLYEAFQEYEDTLERVARKDGSDFIVSHNHHFLGAFTSWFYRVLAGIDVLSADTIQLSPDFACGLEWVEAEYANGGNKLKVRWEKKKDGYHVTVDNQGFNVIPKWQGELIKQDGKTYIVK